MAAADVGDVVAILVELLLRAAVEPAEEEALVAFARERTGIGMRVITRQIKKARQARAAETAKEARERRIAERADPRPMLPAALPDAPWLPEMAAYNEVLGKARDRLPPARNIVAGDLACVQRMELEGSHPPTRGRTPPARRRRNA
jgi:hypothetical protein